MIVANLIGALAGSAACFVMLITVDAYMWPHPLIITSAAILTTGTAFYVNTRVIQYLE